MRTVNSNKTRKQGKKNQKITVLPKFTCYKLMILMDPKNKDQFS